MRRQSPTIEPVFYPIEDRRPPRNWLRDVSVVIGAFAVLIGIIDIVAFLALGVLGLQIVFVGLVIVLFIALIATLILLGMHMANNTTKTSATVFARNDLADAYTDAIRTGARSLPSQQGQQPVLLPPPPTDYQQSQFDPAGTVVLPEPADRTLRF